MTDEFPSVLGIDGSRPNPPTDGYGLVIQNGDSNAGRAMRTAACAGGLPWPHWPLPPRPSLSISYDPRGARLPQRTDGCRTRVRPGPERRRPHQSRATTTHRRPERLRPPRDSTGMRSRVAESSPAESPSTLRLQTSGQHDLDFRRSAHSQWLTGVARVPVPAPALAHTARDPSM